MVIRVFSAIDYRNFTELYIELSEGINLFVGDNGQGKTNLVEGLYFINQLDSFRARNLSDVIRAGTSLSQIQATISHDRDEIKSRVEISRKGRRVWLDDRPISKLSEYVSKFYAIVFNPSHLYSFRHNPADRRLVFDRYISFLDSQYLSSLKALRVVHAQKNTLLKSGDASSLPDWNRLFVEKCYNVILTRTAVVDYLNRLIPTLFERISGRPGRLQIQYSPSLTGERQDDLDRLDRASARELKAGFALYGPHRDEIRMALAGEYGDDRFSQGQYRCALLALKLAMSEQLETEKGFLPVLILDDLFSELDASVKANLEELLSGAPNQIFITATGREHGVLLPHARIMEIRDGKVQQ